MSRTRTTLGASAGALALTLAVASTFGCAETASGEVTWSQKVPKPPSNALLTTAASGSSTIALR